MIHHTSLGKQSAHGLNQPSFASPDGVDFEPRQTIGFKCSNRHYFELTFALDANLPTYWECPHCGQDGLRADGTKPRYTNEKTNRTHWDRVLERRTRAELEALLAERLAELKAGAR